MSHALARKVRTVATSRGPTVLPHLILNETTNHVDYAAKHLISVQGIIDISLNEVTNTAQMVAEFAESSK